MSSKPASIVCGVPFKKALRRGQRDVIEAAATRDRLNVKLPTGYGKTFTACGVYSLLKHQGRCDRALFIFPTDGQLEQFRRGGPSDLADAAVEGPLEVADLRFYRAQAIKRHLTNKTQVFATTIQSMMDGGNLDVVQELMAKGRWLVVIDEYHHYGSEKRWGKVVSEISCVFRLAMSATPYRKERDGAFGEPDIEVDYRKAVAERAVKPLRGHAYIYKIDAVGADRTIHSFTTSDLVSEVGSESPDAIDRFMIERKMRWSPKYVSPLVTIPIERMLTDRVQTGFKLQAIVGAMSVSHAELVCQQIADLYPELTIDWVGTGPDGRSAEQNRKTLDRFLKRDADGRPAPELDVLVHVGMAGEGLDSVLVSEVVHLNHASKNNSNDQENGRAARYIPNVIGHINFDSCSEYAMKGYIGAKIEAAMDDIPAEEAEEADESDLESDGREQSELPDEPMIQIYNLELERIDSGDPGVQTMLKVMETMWPERHDYDAMRSDLTHPGYEDVIAIFRNMRTVEANKHNEQAVTAQWRDAVNSAVASVAGRAVRKLAGPRFDKTLLGDVKRRINQKKKALFGEMANDVDLLKRHYDWVKRLEQAILAANDASEFPEWLS